MPATRATAPFDLTDGDTWGAIWRLSWPLVLTMCLNAATGMLDAGLAGRVSPAAQAAVGLTVQLLFLINVATVAVSVGAQALVSRATGARDLASAARSAKQTLILGAGLSLALLLPVWLMAPGLYALMGAEPAVVETGAGYLRAQLWGLAPMIGGILIGGLFRAQGHTRAILAMAAAESAVWGLGSYTLGLLAGQGLAGLAAGFVLGKLAGFAAGVAFLRRTELGRLLGGPWRLERRLLRRLLAVGLPAGVQNGIRQGGGMVFYAILGALPHPTAASAAYAIGLRMESVAFLPVFSFSIAAATMVGQNLGASRADRAEEAGWRIAGLAAGIMVAFGVLFYAFADTLARFFAPDPQVAAYAADYLRVVAISEPFSGISMALTGALQGAGETRSTLVVTLICQFAFRLPLAWLLAVPGGLGPAGAWWALSLSMVLQGLLLAWWFKRGSWREKRV